MRASRPERLAAWILTGLLLLGCGAWWWRQERVSLASAQLRLAQERLLAELPGPDDPPAAPEAPRTIIVHVAGAVQVPGVYELPEGSRVIDAVHAAGGWTAQGEPHALNLAASLVDGEKVRVPTAREVASGAATGLASSPAAPRTINVNTAGSELLQSLPGIGAVKANAIIQHRREHGPFTAVEELLNVHGIGAATLEKIRDLVTVR